MYRYILKLVAAAALAFALACSGGESGGGVAVTGVGLPKELSVGVGAAETLTAAIAPPDATNKNVAWASSNPDKVAVAGGAGMAATVTGLAGGASRITVATADGGWTAHCDVTVVPAPTGVAISPAALSLAPGGTGTLTAAVLPAGAGQAVVWASGDESVAVVEVVAVVAGDGLSAVVTAVAAGNAGITATTLDGSMTAVCAVTVLPPHSVYVGGDFGLMLDGEPQGAYAGSTVNAMAVDGQGALHACGRTGDDASYWMGGARTALPRAAGAAGAEALAMCLDGPDVYVAGYEFWGPGPNYASSRARLWVNGATVDIPYMQGSLHSVATGVCRMGGDTYLSGGSVTPSYYYNDWGEHRSGFAVWYLGAGRIQQLRRGGEVAYEASSIAAGPDGLLYVGGEDVGVVALDSSVSVVAQPVRGGGVFSVKFAGGALHACGYAYAPPWPPCHWAGPGMAVLPVGPAAAKYVEARDVAVAPDGSVYVCGVDIVVTDENLFAFAPEMWRDGALQHIGGWSGARDMGGAYAVLAR